MHRVWGRARKAQLVASEAEALCNDVFNTARRRNTTDAVWRAEVRAEAAQLHNHQYLQLLWDLKKAFEMVLHGRLAKEADANQAPMRLLRALVAAYRWARHLVLDGMVAMPLWPQNGVAAGCWGALTCLKVYLAETLRAQVRDY